MGKQQARKEGRKCVSDLIRRREVVRDCDCPVLIPQEKKREEEVPRAPNQPRNHPTEAVKSKPATRASAMVLSSSSAIVLLTSMIYHNLLKLTFQNELIQTTLAQYSLTNIISFLLVF